MSRLLKVAHSRQQTLSTAMKIGSPYSATCFARSFNGDQFFCDLVIGRETIDQNTTKYDKPAGWWSEIGESLPLESSGWRYSAQKCVGVLPRSWFIIPCFFSCWCVAAPLRKDKRLWRFHHLFKQLGMCAVATSMIHTEKLLLIAYSKVETVKAPRYTWGAGQKVSKI